MKKIFIFIYILAAYPITFSQEKKSDQKFDSSALKKEGDSKKPLEIKASSPSSKKEKLKSILISDDDPSKLDRQIKALQLILKNERDRNKKVNLYLRLSYLHVSLAKKFGLQRNSGENIHVEEKRHLEEADKILNFLLKNIENNKKYLSTLYNIKGLVDYELNNQDKTVEHFLKSIELYPKNNQAEVMAIFIGEYYFDKEKYEDAIKYYQLFYSRMLPTQKAISDYKVAWSYLNLKDLDKTENQFVKIIKQNLDKGTTEDSYKDLAFLITQNNDENQLIEKVNSFLSVPKLKAKLYYYCLLFYLQNSKDNPRDKLFKEVLSLQNDPYEQLKILGLKVSFERKDIPSQGMVQALENLGKRLEKVPKNIKDLFFEKDAGQLEDDSEYNIRMFVDAYAGRLKTEATISKSKLGEISLKMIEQHLNWFLHSNKRLILYNLWIDTCVDLKNSVCLFSLETKFKKEKDSPEAREFLKKIQIEILAMYDQAFEKEKDKHRAAFIHRLKLFIKNYPQDPISIKSQKRLFGIYFLDKNFKEALPLAQQIFTVEANAENAQKVLVSLFELEKYDEVLGDPKFSQFKTPEILDIRREASLKSALINANLGNFAKYENDIKVYLDSSPTEEKSILVYVDYFKKLIELTQFEKLQSEWKNLKDDFKSKKQFDIVKSLFFDKVINLGEFYKLPEFWSYSTDARLNYQILINRLIMNQKLTSEEIKMLFAIDEDKRNYVFNLLNYTHPETTVEILSDRSNLSVSEQKLLFLAYLLKAKTLNPVFENQQIRNLKDVLDEKFLPDSELKVEKEFKNVVFPNLRMKAKTYESYVLNNVDNIKFLRGRVLKSLNKATKKQKIRILQNMSEIELRMSDSIKKSPAPDGLDDNQLAEYRKGLETMAVEYEKQSTNFQTARSEIENQIKKIYEDEQNLILPTIKAEDWVLPQTEKLTKLNQILEKISPTACIIYLDNQLQTKVITVNEYFDFKTWWLLKQNPSEPLRKLFREELQAANQQAVIEKWKALKK